MNKLNVFNNPKLPWRYPSNWIRYIRMFFRDFKYAYQRITRGYSDEDIWDLDSYYLNLFHDTLTYLADHHMGFPANDEFDTDEKWTAYLKDLASLFYKANENNDYYPHPEEDKWWEWTTNQPNKDYWENSRNKNPYINNMCAEDAKNATLREVDLKEGLEKLSHIFFHLWD